MINKALVRDKLALLMQYLTELQQVASHSQQEFEQDLFVKRTGERTVELVVECAVDINNHFTVEVGGRQPTEYYQSFTEMGRLGVITPDLALALAPTAGLRNRLVHAYETVMDDLTYRALQRMIPQYAEYVRQIDQWLTQRS
ncbi:MAG: DUF86 domain-containing protein [Planctomycetes bacterium]|nr:DUF86 domain-containing protein [Planctomycetota bacterium]MBM4080734.1 DUF86 domain-containing protein [Planctomycetota bacterium]